MKTAHDITEDHDTLNREGIDRLILDMSTPENRVSVGARYELENEDIRVVYVTKPKGTANE